MTNKLKSLEALIFLAKKLLIFALIIPMTLIYGVSKYANSSVESCTLFGVIGISSLIFAAWVVSQFLTNGNS